MAKNIENSAGGTATASTSSQSIVVHTQVTGESALSADELRIWNTGATAVRIGINDNTTDFDENIADRGLIPAGEEFYFVTNGRKPIKSFVVGTESGSSTISFCAY